MSRVVQPLPDPFTPAPDRQSRSPPGERALVSDRLGRIEAELYRVREDLGALRTELGHAVVHLQRLVALEEERSRREASADALALEERRVALAERAAQRSFWRATVGDKLVTPALSALVGVFLTLATALTAWLAGWLGVDR